MKTELKATVHEIVEQLIQDEATRVLDGLRQDAGSRMTGIFYPAIAGQEIAAILRGHKLMARQQQSAPGKKAKRQAKA